MIVLIVGCSTIPDSELREVWVPDTFHDITLYPYLYEFNLYARFYGVPHTYNEEDLRIIKIITPEAMLRDSGPDVIGSCVSYEGTCWSIEKGTHVCVHWREIWIRQDYVQEDTASLRQLMFHELAHCLLDLEHVEDDPLDLMYPYQNQKQLDNLEQAIIKMFKEAGTAEEKEAINEGRITDKLIIRFDADTSEG